METEFEDDCEEQDVTKKRVMACWNFLGGTMRLFTSVHVK